MSQKPVTARMLERLLSARGLLLGVIGERQEGDTDRPLRQLTCDSREAGEDSFFICKGNAFCESYLAEAVRRGSICYMSEKPAAAGVPGLIVTDIRRAMAAVSAAFYGYCPGRPILTGITGTKGKTTTAWYLKAMLDEGELRRGGLETGLISTISNYDGIRREEAVMTTPEPPKLHSLIAGAEQSGLRYLTMEVSSQALKYKRVKELKFDVSIFLNISEDHISPSEHQDFEDYFSAKLSIFRQTGTACVNLDADFADRILKAAHKAKRVVTFGQDERANIRYGEIRMEKEGISFRVTCDRFSERFTLGMRGSFNVENAAAAITAAYVYGVPVRDMQEALKKTCVPGRMERFSGCGGKICGIVDFAHNRLSFERLYDAVFQEYTDCPKVITVFGCPGGKAYNRRKELGILSGLSSDYVIVTADDPGKEEAGAIIREVREYIEMTGCANEGIADRKAAIHRAVWLAAKSEEQTVILVLGRGSEKFWQIGGKSVPAPTDAQLLEEELGKLSDLVPV